MAKNLTVKGILQMSPDDISRKNKSELRGIVNTLYSAANKRIRRIYQSGINPQLVPAIREISDIMGVNLETGEIPKFSLDRTVNNINKLRSYVKTVRIYLNRKTSTVSGAKKYREAVHKLLSKKIVNDISLEREFWRGYNRFMENGSNEYLYDSNQVVAWIRTQIDRGRFFSDRDQIYSALQKQHNRIDLDDYERFKKDFYDIDESDDIDI